MQCCFHQVRQPLKIPNFFRLSTSKLRHILISLNSSSVGQIDINRAQFCAAFGVPWFSQRKCHLSQFCHLYSPYVIEPALSPRDLSPNLDPSGAFSGEVFQCTNDLCARSKWHNLSFMVQSESTRAAFVSGCDCCRATEASASRYYYCWFRQTPLSALVRGRLRRFRDSRLIPAV